MPYELPKFNNDSYIELRGLDNYDRTKIDIEFRTAARKFFLSAFYDRSIVTSADAVLLYNGHSNGINGNHIALVLNGGYVHFR